MFVFQMSDRSCGSGLLPALASEQGNVIGLVSVYICVMKKKL